jgi:phage tail-like protein
MQMELTVPRKRMFDFLPAIYQEPEWKRPHPDAREGDECPICGQVETDREHKNHLYEFLDAFEKVLLGYDDYDPSSTRAPGHRDNLDNVVGLGQKIERLFELFDPDLTPARFLPWLASFTALSLRAGMRESKQRELIKKMISLYRIRGTKKYLETLLDLYLDGQSSSVSEDEIPPLQLGVHHQIGVDTYIGGGPPHFFRVRLNTGGLDASGVEAKRQIAYEVIELAKPAHTTYELLVASPRMQIGTHSTVGLDTVLSPVAA